jgi:hypothetical protein
MVCVSAASAADKVGTRVTLDNIEMGSAPGPPRSLDARASAADAEE